MISVYQDIPDNSTCCVRREIDESIRGTSFVKVEKIYQENHK